MGKDTRFQGYEPSSVIAWQPQKKPKGQDLGPADVFVNERLSSVHIVVEHTLSGVKRCRLVKDVLRDTQAGVSDLGMAAPVLCLMCVLTSAILSRLSIFALLLLIRNNVYYTPTHGSWLNMAEIEIGIFERGCLDNQVPILSILQRHVAALETKRNGDQASIKWNGLHFQTGLTPRDKSLRVLCHA